MRSDPESQSGVIYELEFELDGLPKMSNIASGKSHWRYAYQEAQGWKRLVCTECLLHPKPPVALKRYTLYLTRFSSSEPDFDGLVRGFKSVVDGLKQAGIIADDKITNTGIWNCGWVKAPPKKGKIHVSVVAI